MLILNRLRRAYHRVARSPIVQVKWETAKRWIELISGLSVIFTMIFIALQWNEMRLASADTHELAVQAKAQADAAKGQADNTRSLVVATSQEVKKLAQSVTEAHALAIAAQTANADAVAADRPWIGVFNVSAEPMESDKPITVKVSIVNSGKSPARILRFTSASTIRPTFSANNAQYPLNGSPWPDISRSILLPGMTAQNEFKSSKIEPATFNSLKGIKVRFYVYSLVEYEDIRVKGSRYTTKACAFWTAGESSTSFVNCPAYNDTN